MKFKITLLICLCAIFASCKKDKKVSLTGTLTSCPANSECSYAYYDNADFNLTNQPIKGTSRVFWYKSIDSSLCHATSELYFKTSLGNNDFDIGANQIAAGQVVAYGFICACCEVVYNTKPIGGEIKGERKDASHWLVNAKIIFGNAVNTPIDTLTINQIFSVEKLPD